LRGFLIARSIVNFFVSPLVTGHMFAPGRNPPWRVTRHFLCWIGGFYEKMTLAEF